MIGLQAAKDLTFSFMFCPGISKHLSKFVEYLEKVIVQTFFEHVQRRGEVSDNWAIWSKVRDVLIPLM